MFTKSGLFTIFTVILRLLKGDFTVFIFHLSGVMCDVKGKKVKNHEEQPLLYTKQVF